MNSNQPKHLPLVLFSLRLSVFVVFLVWTLDKFIRPQHASTVYQHFYFSLALSTAVFYVLGFVELVLILGFLLGIQKKLTYGAVLLFHFISTVTCYAQYLAPYEQVNLLFYAAWPMLAACFTLFVLRDYDTLFTFSKNRVVGS